MRPQTKKVETKMQPPASKGGGGGTKSAALEAMLQVQQATLQTVATALLIMIVMNDTRNDGE